MVLADTDVSLPINHFRGFSRHDFPSLHSCRPHPVSLPNNMIPLCYVRPIIGQKGGVAKSTRGKVTERVGFAAKKKETLTLLLVEPCAFSSRGKKEINIFLSFFTLPILVIRH